jgi:hypothetical protein
MMHFARVAPRAMLFIVFSLSIQPPAKSRLAASHSDFPPAARHKMIQ